MMKSTARFGPKTSNAISRFKFDRQLLPADGVVGRKTSAALDAEFPTSLLIPDRLLRSSPKSDWTPILQTC
ncbi:peptidoglycan-binding protein [Peribacillus sp. NJ11]|uniref:peptidoglycan-binding domain-containing protein n=1 Tax=Peribacillus sp. NJ11 TaxID=3055861 RepID=UPI00338DBF53